jgi:hypothetical protein
MALPVEELQQFLLDLVSTARAVTAQRSARLDEADWRVLHDMLRKHRLGPLLHWRLTHERASLPVPGAVRQKLAEDFHRAALRALRFHRELCLLTHILQRAQIASIALKGAFLAYHVYPHPAMRPLRDLDVLVAADQALAAFQALLAAGYRRAPDSTGEPAACLAVRKHLPALYSPAGVCVELHVRLASPCDAIRLDEAGLWERAIEARVAGQTVRYLSHTDLLMHLIFHAVYDHRFDNGPLVVPDLGYLIGRAQIDWALFWRRAAAGGTTRGCVLLLKLMQRYHGAVAVDFSAAGGAALDGIDAVLESSATLMVDQQPACADWRLSADIAGMPRHRQLAIMLRRLFPPRTVVAANSPPGMGRVALYATHVARILTRRLPQFVASRKKHALQERQLRQMVALDRWLREA